MVFLKESFIWILAIIISFVGTIGSFIGINILQEALFTTDEYIMWVMNGNISFFIPVYVLTFMWGSFYLLDKVFHRKRNDTIPMSRMKRSYFSRFRKLLISIFILGNIVILYTFVISITVINKENMVVHSFLQPLGKEYRYQDITEIYTGIHGKGNNFSYSEGDFYYFIKMNDGKKIDLAIMGGTSIIDDDTDEGHPFFIIEKLDQRFVAMKIHKDASMKNISLLKNHYDPIYIEKVQNIMKNN